jgi:hypothetical protein
MKVARNERLGKAMFSFWTLFWICFFLVGIGQAVKGAADIATTVAKDERVQEGFLTALAKWLRGE